MFLHLQFISPIHQYVFVHLRDLVNLLERHVEETQYALFKRILTAVFPHRF